MDSLHKPAQSGSIALKQEQEGCVQGGIYTEEVCRVCGKNLIDNHRNAVSCPDHRDVWAKRLFVRFGRQHKKRFTSYVMAMKWLNHLRTEKDLREDAFDIEDYGFQKPKSFTALAPKYLERKKTLKSYGKICHDIKKAAAYFGTTNVREISGGMLDDYLYGLVRDDGTQMSEKTRANHCSRLHDFWKWCLTRGDVITLAEFPRFPKIEYELRYRKTVTWGIQEQVLAKIREMTWRKNPKIWFACDLLATYTALRPDDLRRVNEASLDASGWLAIFNPTKRKNKFKHIRLHEDHVKQWREFQAQYPALPDMPFFRHHGKVRGTSRVNIVFGENVLYLAWRNACRELNLEGVSLYPGTKHSTATETARHMGSDRAEKASGLSNKAFRRYCQVESEDAFDVVTEIRKKKSEVIRMGDHRGTTETALSGDIKSLKR